MHLLYIIGEPGVGKSTLVEALTAGLPYTEVDKPFAHRVYEAGVVELGRRRPEFSGTDALPMSVQPTVEAWLYREKPQLVIGEGDRLANRKFISWAQAIGYDVTIVHLDGPAEAAARRVQRGNYHPNEAWLRGRRTKVDVLALTLPNVVTLNADQPVSRLVSEVPGPVAQRLRRARVEKEVAA